MKLTIGIILLLLLIVGYALWKRGNLKSRKSNKMELKTVNINDLQLNEIVHEKLSPKQVERINSFQEILKEVNLTPIEKTIENFQRDVHPDREILIWEHIAKIYQKINQENENFNIAEKNEVYNLLLYRSMMSKERVLEQIKLNSLSLEQAIEFLDYWAE